VVVGQLTGTIVSKLQKKSADIELRTNYGSYTIPANEIDLSELTKQFGGDVNLDDVIVNIEIEKPSSATVALVNQSASKAGVTLDSDPINFKVTIQLGNKSVEVGHYTSYVGRTIMTKKFDKITTGVVVDPDGTMRHVPTMVTKNESGYSVVINSLTNSTYVLIRNEVEFEDVKNHWAKQVIEDMASRLIINGLGEGQYKPDQDITRAEFAAVLVRGLGLPAMNDGTVFSDVSKNAWYAQVIQTAKYY